MASASSFAATIASPRSISRRSGAPMERMLITRTSRYDHCGPAALQSSMSKLIKYQRPGGIGVGALEGRSGKRDPKPQQCPGPEVLQDFHVHAKYQPNKLALQSLVVRGDVIRREGLRQNRLFLEHVTDCLEIEFLHGVLARHGDGYSRSVQPAQEVRLPLTETGYDRRPSCAPTVVYCVTQFGRLSISNKCSAAGRSVHERN
jgi:hypothetical protein